MSLTLLGGIAKGYSLVVPKGDTVRPTSVMLRRKVFDANQDLSGTIFIDLCAGTGAVALEAWSRGASQCMLIESDSKVYKVLVQNIKNLEKRFQEEVEDREIQTKCIKALNWLKQFQNTYEQWSEQKKANTIIFFDPPYENKDLYQDIVSFSLREWFKGRIWIESDRQKGLSSDFWQSFGDQFTKTYIQGTSYIAVLDLR